MDRFLNYLNTIFTLSDAAKDYLSTHGKIKVFPAGSYYKFDDEKIEKWCFMLEGLAARIGFENDNEVIERIYCKDFYFSGTKHVFSKTSERISIKFLRKSEIYEIQNYHLRIAFQQYQELQECYLVLKEYEIQYIKDLLSILKSPSKKRLYELHRRQPFLLSSLTVKEKISYLNFKNIKEYYASLGFLIYST